MLRLSFQVFMVVFQMIDIFLHFCTMYCACFVWVFQMKAVNKGTLHVVKTKRWLLYEKCCSFETNFKISHDCHYSIGCFYFMLNETTDPAEHTAYSAQNKEEQRHNHTTIFISSCVSVWLCSKVQWRPVQLDRHFGVLIVWWAIRLANFPFALNTWSLF